MRNHLKRTLSAALAIALLGSAVMLSVSVAKGPYRHAGENAFDGPPVGHPEKALISTTWAAACDADSSATNEAFDWGLDRRDACPKCGFKDSKVTPVVLDMPELLGGTDEAAIEVIKRKLGINFFRGSIFEGPEAPAAQLLKHDEPAELKTFDCVLEKLSVRDEAPPAACGVECLKSQEVGDQAGSTDCAEQCTAACKTSDVAVDSAASDCAPKALATEDYASEHSVGLSLVPKPSDPVELLRQISPGLDELANELESAELYAEADAIREAAQRLRLKARELKSGATARAAASGGGSYGRTGYGTAVMDDRQTNDSTESKHALTVDEWINGK